MGTKRVTEHEDAAARARTARSIVDDLDALEQMLADGVLDAGPPRIGAEQEMLLVDGRLSPARIVHPLLERLGDGRFTSELARFNLEANLTPRFLSGRSLRGLEKELSELCGKARAAASALNADVLLAGYLPTYDPSIAHLGQMVPDPRFAAVNRGAVEPRGGTLQLVIRGRDVLELCHDNIMLEGGATSFQVHLQVTPENFAAAYNCAHLIAAPLIAACANSPLVFSHRLWHETRVPLLEASGDLRSRGQLRRPGASRTSLGDGWVDRSPLEIFRRDLCRFEPVFAVEGARGSTAELRAGRIPSLRALTVFNSTVWRWIRPCYGVTDGRPHLRIENRILPAGPTISDEVANAALWLGLMSALSAELADAAPPFEFCVAEENFHAAARLGLDAELLWVGGERIRARDLLLNRLLPLARQGLLDARVDRRDVDRFLAIVAERTESGRTGARWTLDAFEAVSDALPPRRRSWRVADAMLQLCWSGEPVHRWPMRLPALAAPVVPSVAAVLRTRFVAVPPEAPCVLAEKQLEWSGASHLVVETSAGEFVGLLSAHDLRGWRERRGDLATVAELLRPHAAPALSPDLGVDRALALLREVAQPCAVVLQGKHAAGIVLLEDLVQAVAASETRPQDEVGAAC